MSKACAVKVTWVSAACELGRVRVTRFALNCRSELPSSRVQDPWRAGRYKRLHGEQGRRAADCVHLARSLVCDMCAGCGFACSVICIRGHMHVRFFSLEIQRKVVNVVQTRKLDFLFSSNRKNCDYCSWRSNFGLAARVRVEQGQHRLIRSRSRLGEDTKHDTRSKITAST